MQRAGGLALPLVALARMALPADNVSVVSVTASGNFHAGGVVLTVSGDDNRNATATLEWKPAAQATFRAAHPLVRVDATRLVGSLFSLAPGQSYDARVTLADPEA
jgi:hypothetical protein